VYDPYEEIFMFRSWNNHVSELQSHHRPRLSERLSRRPHAITNRKGLDVVDLKGLVQRELGEGLTANELASAVGVSVRTISTILADELPQDAAIWEAFARYFRIDVDFLRAGGPPLPEGLFELADGTHRLRVGSMRTVPLLNCHQVDQLVTRNEPPCVIHAEAMVETDVSGKRTFAITVEDDSMQPLFSEGEIIFVNPDLPSAPGHYVMVGGDDGNPKDMLLRQLRDIGGQTVLHALNRRYEDIPLTKRHRTWGRVVRLRKNL
jgi:SOS-response transcriptional repressor LexA